MHGDFRERAADLAEIIGRKVDASRADVLLKPMELGGAGNRNDPRFLGQQPGERDLRRCRLLAGRNFSKQIDQGLVRLAGLRREARNDVAEIGTVEGRVLVDGARKEALAQRTEGDEADPELLKCRQNLLLRLAPSQRILALQRGHRLDDVSAADRLYACFGETEVLDLSLLDQFFYRARHVLDRHVRVDTVLVKEIPSRSQP